MERHLASIQTIAELAPIPNADTIERATVLGWHVVVKKGEFCVGDRCVYFEIDSILPADEAWAAFMAPSKFRVKTVRLRGQLSQGLALPCTILRLIEGEDAPAIGTDVTKRLRINKFEAEIPPQVLGEFYPGVPKTDEIRLQSVPDVLKELVGKTVYISTKLDGYSVTLVRPLDGSPVIAHRRNFAVNRADKWGDVIERYQLDSELPPGLVLQGELCGPGVQHNRLKLTQADMFVFNVYDLKTNNYLDLQDMRAVVYSLGMKTVPIEEVLAAPDWTIQQWLNRAVGQYISGNRKEGIVVRPVTETFSNVLSGRLSFKVINNEFLLKDEQ